jgi:hypothetical protein
MELRFDAYQHFQVKAIEAVADLIDGQGRRWSGRAFRGRSACRRLRHTQPARPGPRGALGEPGSSGVAILNSTILHKVFLQGAGTGGKTCPSRAMMATSDTVYNKDRLTPSRKAGPTLVFKDKEPCLSLRLCVSRLFVVHSGFHTSHLACPVSGPPFPPFFLPFRNPKSAIRNAFPGPRSGIRKRGRLRLPAKRSLPWALAFDSAIRNPQSAIPFPVPAVRAMHVSRIFAETLTSTGTFKKRACFDQK